MEYEFDGDIDEDTDNKIKERLNTYELEELKQKVINYKKVSNILYKQTKEIIEDKILQKIGDYRVDESNIAHTFLRNYLKILDSILDIDLKEEDAKKLLIPGLDPEEMLKEIKKEKEKDKEETDLSALKDFKKDFKKSKKEDLSKIKKIKPNKGINLTYRIAHRKYFDENINPKSDYCFPDVISYESLDFDKNLHQIQQIDGPKTLFKYINKTKSNILDSSEDKENINLKKCEEIYEKIKQVRKLIYTTLYHKIREILTNEKISKKITYEILFKMNKKFDGEEHQWGFGYFSHKNYKYFNHFIQLCKLLTNYFDENIKNIEQLLTGSSHEKKQKKELLELVNKMRCYRDLESLIPLIFDKARNNKDILELFTAKDYSDIDSDKIKIKQLLNDLSRLYKNNSTQYKEYQDEEYLQGGGGGGEGDESGGAITAESEDAEGKEQEEINAGEDVIAGIERDVYKSAVETSGSSDEGSVNPRRGSREGGEEDEDEKDEYEKDDDDNEEEDEEEEEQYESIDTGPINDEYDQGEYDYGSIEIENIGLKEVNDYYISDRTKLPKFILDSGIKENAIPLFFDCLDKSHEWIVKLSAKISRNEEKYNKMKERDNSGFSRLESKVLNKRRWVDDVKAKELKGRVWHEIKGTVSPIYNKDEYNKEPIEELQISNKELDYIPQIAILYKKMASLNPSGQTNNTEKMIKNDYKLIEKFANKIPIHSITSWVNQNYLRLLEKANIGETEMLHFEDNLKDVIKGFRDVRIEMSGNRQNFSESVIENVIENMDYKIFLEDNLKEIDINRFGESDINEIEQKVYEEYEDWRKGNEDDYTKWLKEYSPYRINGAHKIGILGTKTEYKKLLNPIEYTVWKKYEQIVKMIESKIKKAEENMNKKDTSVQKKSINRTELNSELKNSLKLILNNYINDLLTQYPKLKEVYHEDISYSVNLMENYITTNFIYDHLLIKEYLLYYIQEYNNRAKKIKSNEDKIKETDKTRLGRLSGIRERGLGNETTIIINILTKNKLINRLNQIKEYIGELTFKNMLELEIEKQKLELFYQKYDFSESEKYLFLLSIQEIKKINNENIKKEIERSKKVKKGLRWVSDKFKDLIKPVKPKDQIKSDLGELKQEIKEDQKEEGEKEKELSIIDKISEENKKIQKLVDKYDNIQKINEKEIQRLKFEKDNAQKSSRELLKNIQKYKRSRTEISIKARELLADRLRQLNEKKKLKEDAMNDIILKTEKMNIALDKIKIDHKKKIEEMKKLEELQLSYINEEKKLRKQKIKMALDEATIENKKKRLRMREKKINENQRKLTLKSSRGIPINYISGKIRRNKRTKKKKLLKKTKRR